jgi:Glycosyltransferase WbsX
MSALGGPVDPQRAKAKALAFYLPQYHPIPENDEWWGKGFTEWINVTKARPLFPGHYQPHVPGELGYYDLRVPEVREAQADLARQHGLSGFVYYHYWFHGRRLLERPFEEVLASGSPDFPFALCWANEEWTRNWDGQSGRLLIPQEHSDQDDLDHIRWLCAAFADDRYIKIDGRPLMLVYRPLLLPDARRTTDLWRAEAQKFGFPDLYLSWVEGWGRPPDGPEAYGFDATVGFMPPATERLFTPLDSVRGHQVLDYVSAYEGVLKETPPAYKRFPSVMVGWDNTARRPRGATIFDGATPEAYARWLEATVASLADVREEERYLFVLAWNEWAEGNHLEPDQHYGRAFLEATRGALIGAGTTRETRGGTADAGLDTRPVGPAGATTPRGKSFLYDSPTANAVRMVREITADPERLVLGLGTGSEELAGAFGPSYRSVDLQPGSLIADVGSSVPADDRVGVLLLLDGIEQLAGPHDVLADLSAWALDHGDPILVLSVPNVAHFDVGLRLLCGEWAPGQPEPVGSVPLHFFTESALEQLVERCGWRIIAREDFDRVNSDGRDLELEDSIPEEMVGALRVLSQTYNPQSTVQQFVWALTPVKIEARPTSFAAAVQPPPPAEERELPPEQRHPVYDYMASVGIVASEINRRAVAIRRKPRPRWKRAVLDTVNGNPRTADAYKQLRRWFG